MGYRRAIHNEPVVGSKFSTLKTLFYDKLGLVVKNIFRIRKEKNVYRVNLQDGLNLRLDIFKMKAPKDKLSYHRLAYDNGVSVPKIIEVCKLYNSTLEDIFKVSEWIEGVRIEEVWNLSKVFEKCGEQIAKLNLIKDPVSDKYLSLRDFSPLNFIWTKEKEVYIIDLNIFVVEDVDYSVVKTLVMGLRTKNRIDCFLKGYMKFRSTDRIMKILKKYKWKWKNYSLAKETHKDKLI